MAEMTDGPIPQKQLKRVRRWCFFLVIAGIVTLAGMIFAIGQGETYLYEYLPLVSALTGGFGAVYMISNN